MQQIRPLGQTGRGDVLRNSCQKLHSEVNFSNRRTYQEIAGQRNAASRRDKCGGLWRRAALGPVGGFLRWQRHGLRRSQLDHLRAHADHHRPPGLGHLG